MDASAQRPEMRTCGYVELFAAFLCAAPLDSVHSMNTTFVRAREISLALLVSGVVAQQRAPADPRRQATGSCRLLRLGRELIRAARAAGRSPPVASGR